MVREAEQAKLGAAQLALPGGLDKHLFADVFRRRAGRGVGRQRLRDGVLGHADRVQCAVDAGIFRVAADERRFAGDGDAVAVGAGLHGDALAVGYVGWASVCALSRVGDRCGSLEPGDGAIEPGCAAVGGGEGVAMPTTLYCWRCGIEVPMLSDAEWQMLRRECQNAGSLDYEALMTGYEELTGFKEKNPNAIFHHIITSHGPPCKKCGRPLRSQRASFCASCGEGR